MPTLKLIQRQFVEHSKRTNKSQDDESHRIFGKSLDDIFQHFWAIGLPDNIKIPNGNKNINRKGTKESEAFRNEGNRLYKSRKFEKALLAYNYALLVAPHPEEPLPAGCSDDREVAEVLYRSQYSDGQYCHLAFAFANRSALLLEMEQHGAAISDIHNAIRYGYTRTKLYKMHERKIKCLMGLQKYQNAKILSDDLMKNISKFDIDPKEISQIKASLSKQSSKCDSLLGTTAKNNDLKKEPNKSAQNIQSQDKKILKINTETTLNTSVCDDTKYSKLFFRGSEVPLRMMQESRNNEGLVNTAVTVRRTAARGRHLVATRNIEPGEVLLLEESHSSFLCHNSLLRSHCSHCLRRAVTPLPCPVCSLVVFCSQKCRTAALSARGGHRAECRLLPALVALQPEVDAGLTFKVMTTTHMPEIKINLEKLKGKRLLNNPVNDSINITDKILDDNDLQRLLDKKQADYEFLYTLEGNLGQRSGEDKRDAAITALVFVKLLLQCPSFRGENCDNHDSSSVDTNDVITLGGQLMRLFLNIQCNAHCIKELKLPDDQPFNQSHYTDVGFGLFHKFSLLNHSCTPNTHQSSLGNKKVLYTISGIEKGEEITMSYGERFVSHTKDIRQENIKETYFFTCDCRACLLDWPLFTNLSIKFNLKCCKCSNPIDSSNSKCKSCQLLHKIANKKINNKKGKKINQESSPQNLYDAASCQHTISKAWQEYNQAYANIGKLQADTFDHGRIERLLSLMDKYAHLPNKPYIEAQESLIRWFDLQASASFKRD